MRNFDEFPITEEEKLAALQEALKYFSARQYVGDIRPVALKLAIQEWKNRHGD